MASYQARARDPLLDRKTQAAIERRGKELLGLSLLGLGFFVALMLWTYVPEDPSWLSATDAPAQNFFGRFGASLASPLYVIVGLGGWAIALTFAVWGLRFMLHRGEERALSRAIFAPIAVALVAVYASTHAPGADWPHSFGLGGLFGDTVLGAVLGVAPVNATFGLKLLSALFAAGALVMGLFVLGFDRAELRRFGRFLLVGFILVYDRMLREVGRAGGQAVRAAGRAREQRRAERLEDDEMLLDEDDAAPRRARVARAEAPLRREPSARRAEVEEPAPAAVPRAGLLSRMPRLMRRSAEPAPEPELVTPQPLAEPDLPPPSEDRIKEKIANVIKSRVRAGPAGSARAEPPVIAATRDRRGPAPLIAQRAPAPAAYAPAPEAVQDAGAYGYEDAAGWQAEAYDDGYDFRDAMPAAPGFAAEEEVAPQAPAARVERGAAGAQVQPKPQSQPAAQPAQGRTSRVARPGGAHAPRPARAVQPYERPPLELLTDPAEVERHHLSDEALEDNARMLESVLDDYGVKGEIVSVRPGPVVTMYELEPAPGLKASRVIGLADDIARSMSALSARVSTVPGRSVIGIELPNERREKVVLREILSQRDFTDGKQSLPLALGKDIGGDPIVANLAKMPHLLIAGTTGSGKSVAINTMILSLLYKLSPEECRLIMIDPKMLELSVYDGIPHLLSPVVTDPKKAVVALKWVVGEMEDRYRKMSKMGVRNIEGYNSRVRDTLAKGEMFSRTVQTGFDDETGDPIFETEEFQPEVLPFIVVVVDEMADLMMVAGKEIEACIQRLAQMARASGIHLIMATQRPSVDVITGTIKANFPTRISFQVTSKIDSRTILGEQGAEQLLGMGDMLFMAGGAKITRVHGPFCSDEEVEEIVNHLKAYGPPEYVGGVVEGPDEEKESDIDAVLGLGGNTDGEDALYDQAVAIVIKDRKCSTSYIQRKLAIGYNKAARLVEQMEEQGLVSAANHVGKREILVPEQS